MKSNVDIGDTSISLILLLLPVHFPDLLLRLVEEKGLVRDALPPPIPVPLDDGQRPPPAQVDLGV